ncbi:phosphoribosylanthranilate isomerase [Lysinibacillus sp. 54212]|uniref:phosphoribosylanthranilate isomerase n=1 Tax=Lysinibacillus sp. 54212 TaxID=3119829 RepID=UPI002FC6F806
MTVVKICGLTREEHVETAVAAGVDFVGFVFAPSKRRISVEDAQRLSKKIPSHIKKVGVFVNATRDEIEQIAKDVPLDFIQYHGDEKNEWINSIGLPSIKAFSIHSKEDVEKAALYSVDYYLFDAPGTDYRGGSGHTFDWTLLEEAHISMDKVILAGGLHAENVSQAIELVKPFGVDVSSGVEKDGMKDHDLIKAFLTEAKGAKKQ